MLSYLDCRCLTVRFEKLFVHIHQCSANISPQTLRRFICNLHTVLKNCNRESICGHRAQIETEGFVDIIWILAYVLYYRFQFR
jgi:hypothetical protein